jgi:hypothetical protein
MYKPFFDLACTESELASYQTNQGFNNNFKKPLCVIGS